MFKSRKNQCSYIIFLALFLFFNPILVLAQTGSVTLSMKNATLKQFFEAVEKQTTYIFYSGRKEGGNFKRDESADSAFVG